MAPAVNYRAALAAACAMAVPIPSGPAISHNHSGQRSRGVPHRDASCPKCGRFLRIGQTGLCRRCGAGQ